MELQSNDPHPVPAPGQTIVIERPARRGCLRRLVGPLLVLGLGGYIAFNAISRESGLLPSRLTERYVAGSLSPTGPKVAVVEVDGVIMGEVVEHAIKQVRQARDDDDVKAVVLRVDSPGGTVSGSDRIWREVEILARAKPVVASMGGVAASGGYYVSAPAKLILAEPTTWTGSIGVIAEFPQVSELLEKVGVDFETIATGKWKDSGSMFRPMTEEEHDRWRSVIDQAYQRFVRVVAQGRKLPLDRVIEAANGKVYTADEALDLGLINAIGYLDDAIAEARTLASIPEARVIRYAKPIALADLLIGLTAPKPGLRLDAETLLRLRTPQAFFLAR